MKKTRGKAIKKFKGDTTPAGLIQAAVAGGADLEKLEKLLDLQIRWEKNEAKKAYVIAMVAFQADPPVIEKNKHVAFDTSKGKVKYNHATLPNVVKKIEASLSKHGFSVSFPGNSDEKGISVTCKITHIMGHSEETTLKSASDLTGGKNAIQAIGSAVSYLQRYTLLSLTGLATEDMDDDGKSTEDEKTKKRKTKPATASSDDKKKDDSTPVSIGQATIIIQNIIGSHLIHNFEKWRFAKTIFDGQNILTKTKASEIIEWWIGKTGKNGKILKESERHKRLEIEKQDDDDTALNNFLTDRYDKYAKKYPEDLKKYSYYCGLNKKKLPFDILDTQILLKTYLEYRQILGLDNRVQGEPTGGKDASTKKPKD